jgi:WXG100 protein secretion system (Wss), protein YukD
MGQIRVSIVDPSNRKKTQVEVPDDVRIDRLLSALVLRMALPSSAAESPITYKLGYLRNAAQVELDGDATLQSAGVRNGDVLRLYVNIDAGVDEAVLVLNQSAKALHDESQKRLFGTAPSLRITDADRRLLVNEIIDAFEARALVKIINRIDTTQKEREATQGSLLVKPIFGAPAEHAQCRCDAFMVMPFSDQFQSIYDDYIKPVIESFSLSILRGDDLFTTHNVIEDIWSALARSRFVIADCTGRNANVFYELGIAHTLGKPVILLAQAAADLPFDIQGRRAILYEDRSGGLTLLQRKLKESVRALLAADEA